MPFITLNIDGQTLRRTVLDGEIVIGRAEDCPLCIPDARLSRRHVRLVPTQRGWVAQDLGSRNGTRLFGEPVTQHLLADGDVLELGTAAVTLAFNARALIDAHLDDDEACDILSMHDSGAMDAIHAAEAAAAAQAPTFEAPAAAIFSTSSASPSPARSTPVKPGSRNLWDESSTKPEGKPQLISRSSPTDKRRRLYLATAASVVLLIAGGWFYSRQQQPPVPIYTPPTDSAPLARASGPRVWDND